MRLLIASAAALVAVAFAAPSFAQDDAPPAAAPTAKPKPGTSAYCQTLKSASSRSACMKKVSAQPKAAPTKTAKAKAKKPTTTAAPKQPDSAQLPPAAAPAPASGTVAVPPLPSKTI
ncbi:MAG: hypothetical protein K2Y40_19200 [Reyranella sp.]|nr:hypothetical protein [Reyranella sp.]